MRRTGVIVKTEVLNRLTGRYGVRPKAETKDAQTHET